MARTKMFTSNQMYWQATQGVTACFLEKYAILPIYLRARVEDWDIQLTDLTIELDFDTEQVQCCKTAFCIGNKGTLCENSPATTYQIT